MTNSKRRRAMALAVTLALLGALPGYAQDPVAKPGEPQATGRGHSGRVQSGVFTPDSKTFFSAGADKVIRAWNVADGKELFKLPGHNAPIQALGLAGDKLLVSAGEDGSIYLWDLVQRAKAGELPRHIQPIHCLAVSHDGAMLATGGGTWNKPDAGELRLWDLRACKEITQLEGHRKLVRAVAFSPDGRRLAAGDNAGDLKIWDTVTRKAVTMNHEKIPSAAQYSPDGKWLAVGDAWGHITVYDADTLAEDAVVRGHRGSIFSLHYKSQSNILATAGFDGAVRLWNPHQLEEQAPVQVGMHKDKAWMVRFAPDGQTLASGGDDALVRFWAVTAAIAKRFESPAIAPPVEKPAPALGPARVALLCSKEIDTARNVQDLALAKLGAADDIVLLDRSTVERLLGEQKLSLNGLVDASTAVKAGKILAVDLLAIVEYSSEAKQNTGFVILNAATGAKLADSGFTGKNLEPQALHMAAGVRAAAVKWRAGTQNIKTLCLLPARNADLPRSMDRFCETLGAALERDLLGFEGTALLERKRLDLVNKEKNLAAEAANRALLASLAVLELEVSRGKQGVGIRGVVIVRDNAGKELHRIVHEVDDPNGAGLLTAISTQIQAALKNAAPNAQANRNRESRRFLREAQLLWTHKYYLQGLRAAETAFALKPSEDASHLLAEYLMRYATELMHPGGMRTSVGGKWEFKVQPETLREALDLSRRGLQLMEASRSPVRMIAGWVETNLSLEPPLITDARRFLFNKIPYVRVVPENAEVQQELDDFRLYCLQRLVARCHDAVKGEPLNAYTLDRFTYVIQDSTTAISTIAPTRAIYTRTLHDLAMKWLDLASSVHPASMSPETASKFGEYLSQIYLPNMLAGQPAQDSPTALFDRAMKHPHPVVKLYAGHHYRRLMVKLEKMPIEEAVAGHRAMLAEGMRLIDNPPIGTPDRFRVAMYRLMTDAISHLYIHKAGRDVGQEYFDLCDFMLARNDVVEDVVRAAVNGYGSNVRERNIKALQIIDKAIEVTDSPTRRHFADSPERFKFNMKEARRTVLAHVPDLQNVEVPWESIKPLVGMQDLIKLNANLLVAAVVHDKQIYYFTGGEDTARKHLLLQLLRMPVEGGVGTVLGKTVVAVDNPPAPNAHYVFWISPEPFVTTTAIAHDKLYAGTVSEGILVFPLAGGNPTRIGEKEGLPSRSVHKLVVVDNTLVAALEGGYIVTHDLVTGRTDVAASSRRAEKLSPFDNTAPFRLDTLIADPKRQRVLFRLGITSINDPRGGLWEFNLASRQFKKLEPAIYGAWSPVIGDCFYLFQLDALKRESTGLLAYDLTTDKLAVVHGKAATEFGKLATAEMPGGSVPFPKHLLHDGHYWSAYPFGRHSLDGTREENYPSLRDQSWQYSFSARVSLQAVSPNELLIGDLSGLYLVRLKPKVK